MSPAVSKRLRLLASAVSVLVLLAVLAAAWYYSRFRASLPQLDGSAKAIGLAAAVTVERDALGVPTIRGGSRADVARALGWLHGQERFFQMDLLRRLPAGELAEVFGPRAVPRDRQTRMHGFRQLARTVVAQMDAPQRSIVESYTEGVNAGITALGEKPFEYLILREVPQPWRTEDSILVAYAMTLDLQEEEGAYERTLMTLRDQLGLEGLAFFAPIVGPADAALDGTTAHPATPPGPKTIDLRTRKVSALLPLGPPATDSFPFPAREPGMAPGSNAFALAGTHTASGAAMVANDMHLDYGVPNIWYRASLEYGGRKITGVTLPGVPLVIAGSNGRVAWGFTNGYVDTGDLVVVELNNIAPTLYRAPGHEELVPIERRRESIRVKGGEPIVVDYVWTVWGPVVGADERKKPLVHRWVMHDPVATNLSLLGLESVTTTAEAVAVAHRAGMPAQNILIADHAGDIAWTIAGRLPKRVGHDGRLPVTWSFGDRRWEGLLPPDEVPTVYGKDTVRPGLIWSANNRHVGGEALAKLGDGAYRGGARASQIRDGLAGLKQATPRDVLAVQLDERALFLERWHRLLLATLKPEVVAQKKARAALRTAAEKWEGRATIEAVSYRLVREFRDAVQARVYPAIFATCVEANPAFNWRELQLEDAFWAMWREKPLHLLNPEFASWDDLLTAAADDVIRALDKNGVSPAKATWGARNTVQIQHPFVRSYPWLAHWLSMPADRLPGDNHMPRVQSRTHGASERLVVSPGRESEGIFHMPGGQSAHPLSPFFRAGHDAWVRGEPTPFLPGKPVHTLMLQP